MPKDIDDFERQPNPPGWVPPKAPYNPYDPLDARPAGGYPSEFNSPSAVKRNTGLLARDLDDYQRIKVDMKTLQYYPKPLSELYPGRHKVLRRINVKSKFNRGADLTAKISIYGFVLFGVFFYKWNDHENIFAPFRRLQLRVKELAIGELDMDDYNDLYNYKTNAPIPQKPLPSMMYDKNVENKIVGEGTVNNEFIQDRFGNKHVVYVEHIKQQEQEIQMRDLDRQLRERQDMLNNIRDELNTTTNKPFWKFW